MSLADDLKKQTNDFRTKKIDYQVDTIGTDNNKGGAGGYYTSATNTITMNYHEADKWLLNWEKNSHDVILYHEQKHRSNANKGFKSENIRVSPEQYYKLCMADEISANMAGLVYLREEYIKTGDINVFDKENERYSFYKEAVQKGEVNPLSSDPKDFEKDMSLIMNGTQEMWMAEFAGMYSKNHIAMTEYYLRYGKGNFKDNEAEYQKQLDIAYTIGGVNFKQYMQKDMNTPSMEGRKNAEYLIREKQLQFKDNMSFEQYSNLLQHLHIASNIKAISDDYLSQMKVKSIDAMSQEQRKAYTKAIQESVEYSREGLKNEYVKRDVNMSLNKALGWAGKRVFVPSENDANYQAALKSLYNINGIDHYTLLKINPQEKMPIEKTTMVKDFEKRSLFMRGVYKIGRWEFNAVQKVSNLFKKKEEKTPEPKAPKNYLKNYPKWSENKRVSEIQYEEILDLDKPVITGRPGAQRSQSTSSENTGANNTSSATIDVNNLTDKQAKDIKILFLRDPREANAILKQKGNDWMNSRQLQEAWDKGDITPEQKAELVKFAGERFDERGNFVGQDAEKMEAAAKAYSAARSAQNVSVAETPALTAQNTAAEKTNMDKAAYLRSLSGRTQQDTIARSSPSFSQMRDNKNSMELMLLRRQMGR